MNSFESLVFQFYAGQQWTWPDTPEWREMCRRAGKRRERQELRAFRRLFLKDLRWRLHKATAMVKR